MDQYRSNHNVAYQYRYHVVFCPKYRRKVLVAPIDERLKTILWEQTERWGQEMIELEVMPDHVHLLLGCDQQFGIHRLVKLLKGHSSHALRAVFPALKRRLPSLWTNSYIVATVGGVTRSTCSNATSRARKAARMATLKTFQYRLYPTKEQSRLLHLQMEECRWLWNTLLAERKQAWEERRETVDYYAQKAALPGLKAGERPSLGEVHSQVLQDVVLRLKKAFDAFFRRVKAGEEPGYPRFRGAGRYDSLTFPQVPVGCALETTDATGQPRLVVSKVGRLKIVLHRPLEGTPKTATIRRTATGKWFVTFSCEWEPTPLPPTGREVGLDVGLTVFAMPSDERADPIENPRFFREEAKVLAHVQRLFQRALDAHTALRAELTARLQAAHPDLDARAVWQAVSQEAEERAAWKARGRRRQMVARVHERVRWRRAHFAHQESRRLVNGYDFLAVEDLSVRQMMANHSLAKSIHDAAWRLFLALIACKAEWAGRRFVAVNPAYTSQECSGCGHHKTDLTLADRTYVCAHCGVVLDRDRNAARNILARGRALVKT